MSAEHTKWEHMKARYGDRLRYIIESGFYNWALSIWTVGQVLTMWVVFLFWIGDDTPLWMWPILGAAAAAAMGTVMCQLRLRELDELDSYREEP